MVDRNLGDPYTFCYKWLRCGGEIWMDLTSPLTHIGNTQFRGNAYTAYRHLLELREI